MQNQTIALGADYARLQAVLDHAAAIARRDAWLRAREARANA